ncbi:MAG TPA: tRNA adenosine(34) deaminase TadA [Gemmatimonas sp.]|nr:tRNA adenosine(34) deaminase TadA [Gemmatimonas sp.]
MFARPGDERWMRVALQQAAMAGAAGEVPVGACIVADDAQVSVGSNGMAGTADATQHAELRALQAAMRVRGDERLTGCTLYVTLEPCAMCAGAIVLARVDRVVFAAWDAKAGMAGSVGDLLRHPRLNHRPEVCGGVLERDASAMLADFFARLRSVRAGASASASGARHVTRND